MPVVQEGASRAILANMPGVSLVHGVGEVARRFDWRVVAVHQRGDEIRGEGGVGGGGAVGHAHHYIPSSKDVKLL